MTKQQRRGGLGRGLDALIPTAPEGVGDPPRPPARPVGSAVSDHVILSTAITQDVLSASPMRAVDGSVFQELEVATVRANRRQPRTVFDEEAMTELTHSIREFGVLQPVVVRPIGADGYELVMGERRLRAAIAAGLTTIPAIVRDTADDAMLRDAVLENIHRASLNPLEEAAAYHQLLDDLGATHDELAQRLGRSRSHISNTIRLLNLPVPVQRRVAAGVISAGHARALLALDDLGAQEDLATRIVAEGMSVRATEEAVAIAGRADRAAKAPRRAPGPRITAPGLTELATKLSDTLDTTVKVELGRRKGKIIVEFATVADLERIVAVMDPRLELTHRSAGRTE
ncbi:MAG: ParB/RepB/Spo0J family partition protein [Actinomycetia bacterium]|nr:ParB/RepB/Spo0J family partition protein [Actinomycetes bacterium]